MAGYNGCGGRFAFRIDADEVPFFDEAELGRFFSSGQAIAEMYKPSCLSPGWLLPLDQSGRLPREPMLFDRARVDAEVHLNYLWLILGPDRLPDAKRKPFTVYQPPIGLNAHLTGWRGLDAQIDRAAFYRLLSMRGNGVPWVPELRGKPLADVRRLFEFVSPGTFREVIASSCLASQPYRRDWLSTCSPLAEAQEQSFKESFTRMQREHAALNRMIADGGLTFWTGAPIVLDLSTDACTEAVTSGNTINLSCTYPLSTVTARLHLLVPGEPWHVALDLECDKDDRSAVVRLPDGPMPYPYLRRELDISLPANNSAQLQRFRVVR
jgi:hypothetical protein